MLSEMTTCHDCSGSRAVPDVFGDLTACPSCVIEAGDTWVVYEEAVPQTKRSSES